jgi:hypothetical protein
MTIRMTLPDTETGAAMLATRMDYGMEASYVWLETMIWEASPYGNLAAEFSITDSEVRREA